MPYISAVAPLMLTYTTSVMRILLLLLFLGAPSVLHAQEADLSNLSPGTWVRVQAPTLFQGRSEAMVWKLSPDTLYLGDLQRVRRALPITAVEKIKAKRGDIGLALAGIVAGGWIGGRMGHSASFARERPEMHPAWHIVEIAAAGAVGGAVGGFAGSIVEAILGWKQVIPARSRR